MGLPFKVVKMIDDGSSDKTISSSVARSGCS
ncbi:hypothetical protein L195_g061396 [Trifolium pratense]|uniref:Uncharacterized protein n=1 Tax=Trifolium pratense TaxID=57577 RepID=A0A2K3K9J9_TRIPR|nr:hypothetical protein L195_g061396 [Trifolium pratense]